MHELIDLIPRAFFAQLGKTVGIHHLAQTRMVVPTMPAEHMHIFTG